MTALGPALRRVVSDLVAAGARWALVGGIAAGVRSEPRFTRDIDLVAEFESLLRELDAAGP